MQRIEPKRRSIFELDSLKTICPPLLTALLFVAVVYNIFLPSFENALMERKKEMLHELTESAWSILQNYDTMADRGEISPEKAKQLAIDQIRQLRYGKDHKDYFWINDTKPTMVMHPYRTDLEGKDLSRFVDPTGKDLFNRFVEVTRLKEEGYVDYMWQWKDDLKKIVPKISFVKSFQPWGWIVGTGLYVEDVQQEIAVISRKVMIYCSLIFSTVLLLSAFMVNNGLHIARKRRNAEEQLELHYANLENTVQERTHTLEQTNRQLHQEIKERTELQAAYRESEKKYRSLYETANDAIVLLDGCRFISCNPKTLDIFSCPESDFIDKNFLYYSPELQPDGTSSHDVIQEKISLALSGSPQFFEWRFQICRSMHIDAEISLNRVELVGKEYLQAIIRDITRRKFMEKEVQHARHVESLGILAGGIAHDFNNLLTAIIGNVSLARLKSKDPSVTDLLTRTETACKRASDLSRQLLTFARGGGPMKEVVRITDLIQEVCNFALCGAKTCCRYDLADDLDPVDVDRNQISRLLQNLVINAVQAMPDGGKICVTARNTKPDNKHTSQLRNDNYVQISVSDSGRGIPPELLPKIFDPYFTTKDTGSGLGLAIAYSIAKKHNGLLTVASDASSGTTFHLFLPAAKKTARMVARKTDKLPQGEGKILIMDDEPAIRELAAEIMKTLGYTPVTSSDGHEVVDLYRKSMQEGDPYAAVILDLTVPGGMGGREAMVELRQIDPGIKAVVSSGYADDDAMAHYEKYGFCAVIPKPYSIENFARICQKILKN